MDVRDKIYINGAWVPSTGTGTLEVIDSATEEVFATIPEGTPEDVDKAVQAAAAAFPAWAATSREERGKLLKRIGEALAARTDEIAADHLARGRHADDAVGLHPGRAARPGPSPTRPTRPRPSRGKRRSATRSSCTSRSASSAPSRRGTTRSTRSPSRWRRPWPPAAPSCSSRARWRRSTPSSWPRSSTRWACRRASSTW